MALIAGDIRLANAQANALAFAIDPQYLHHDFIANAYHL
jgi:hypothetical protein